MIPKKTLIIAEAGVNHNGNLLRAKKLVDAAAAADADIVKFQTFKASKLTTRLLSKADYQKNSSDDNQSQFDLLQQLELNDADYLELREHCESREIEFLSTGFDIESVDYLIDLGITKIKIPSGEITNLPYLRHVGSKSLPIILSTGMSNIVEIASALEILTKSGTKKENITLLHCTSEYPAPMSSINLNALSTIRDEFGVSVGYSDHSQGIEVAVAAVALGARIIEKHFTLDKNLPGPDHKASLNPSELESMVKAIRNVERAMGSPRKVPTLAEEEMKKVARKFLVASRQIKKGEFFTTENIVAKRAGSGLSPMELDNIIGMKSKQDFSPDEIIQI